MEEKTQNETWLRRNLLLAIMLVASLFMVGLSTPSSAQKTDRSIGTCTGPGEEGKAGAKGSATPEESGGKMEAYKEKLQEDLRELDKKISALGRKMKKEGAKLHAEAKASWNELKGKEKTARAKLKDLSSSSRETWEKTKSEADAAMDQLRKAYDRAVSYFKS